MAVLASDIVSAARIVLQDADAVRWSNTELLGYLNEGQAAIVVLKPTAYVKVVPHQLVAGTRQPLPADGEQLIDVPRNMGTNGTTPGRVIRITERAQLDAADPAWHTATADNVVVNYTYELNDPKHFMVYPPQPTSGRGQVELVYGAVPPAAALGEAIALADSYRGALLDYVLSRAYAKDSEHTAASGKPLAHRNAFIAAVTGKVAGENATNPNRTAPASPGASN